MEKHFVIECDCKPDLVRLLSKHRELVSRMNNIEDSISKIFDLFDNLDDLNAITVATKEITEQVKQIGQTEEL